MEPGRFPARTQTAVVTRPRPDSPNHEDVITIDLPFEAATAPSEHRVQVARDLPEALRGMYYTG